MKTVIKYLVILLFFIASPCSGEEDIKIYSFEKCLGQTVGGSSICYQITIEIFNVGTGIKALYNIDGFQSMTRLICTSERKDSSTFFYFEKYGEDDMYKSTFTHKKGELCFILSKENRDIYLTQYLHPGTGALVAEKIKLSNSNENDDL